MLDRNSWNAYGRPDQQSRWTWLASGAFFTEANGAAMLKTQGQGELVVIFGRQLPTEYEQRWRRMTA
jgi:hypothetical protein